MSTTDQQGRRALSRRLRTWLLGATAAVLLAVAFLVGSIVVNALRILEPAPLPAVPPRPVFATWFDQTPVALTVTAAWQKVPMVVPAYLVTSDRTLWQKMHFEDWNTVPSPIRERALSTMVEHYRRVADGPRVWRRMTAEDWDGVPQPIRAIAFIRMARYWGRRYRVGLEYGLPPRLVDNTLAAILMVESWFEHRGAYTNADGTQDVGLGGSSDYCRRVMRELHAAGQVDFAVSEHDYFNPWHAIRVVVVWLDLMIDEADGDLDRAIAAYHVGISATEAGRGMEYAANVVRKRRRFIRNMSAPPAWTYLYTAIFGRSVAR